MQDPRDTSRASKFGLLYNKLMSQVIPGFDGMEYGLNRKHRTYSGTDGPSCIFFRSSVVLR